MAHVGPTCFVKYIICFYICDICFKRNEALILAADTNIKKKRGRGRGRERRER